MTETDPDIPAPAPLPAKTPRSIGRNALLFVVIVLVAAGLPVAAFWPPLRERILPPVGGIVPLQEKIATLEGKVQALDTRVNDLDTRIDSLTSAHPQSAPPAVAAPAPEISNVPAANLAHMQADLIALSAAVSGLQAEIKQTASVATVARTQTQTTLAEAVAYLQLRAAAMSGHGFADEMATLRAAAKNDPGFEESLGKIAPYADKGTPDLAALREELVEQMPAVRQAVAVAGAQNWWQRVLAELKGLVLIRPVHDTAAADDPPAAMESALARDDLAAALEQIKNLPPGARKALDQWHSRAEARLTIDDALRAMADHLIASANAASTALSAPDMP